ncbi:MAG: GNAT family N-acetyltransferase [archaeon]|nr:GNAT family N-acetyltransferase [archaeon]
MNEIEILECTRDDIPDFSRIMCLSFWDKWSVIFKGLTKEETVKVSTDLELATFGKNSFSGRYIVKKNGISAAAVHVSYKELKIYDEIQQWNIMKKILGFWGSIRAVILDYWLFSEDIPEDTLHIDSICVDEKFRNQGIGKEVLAFIDNLAIEMGFKKVRLEVIGKNIGAKELYEREGFIVERYRKSWWGKKIFNISSFYYMRKDLK